MPVNAKTVASEARAGFAGEQSIEKHPAAENDRFEFSRFPEAVANDGDDFHHSRMEAPGDTSRGGTGSCVTKNGLNERPRVHDLYRLRRACLCFFDCERIVDVRHFRHGQRFEFDRRLSLITHTIAYTGKRSHGIEQPAGTGSERRIQPPPKHRSHHSNAALQTSRLQWHESCIRVFEVRDRHSPRFADGLLPSRQSNSTQMCCASDSTVIPCQEFTTPDGSISSVTGAVKAHAKHRFRQPVLGHAACHVRMVMLNAEN